MIQEAYNRETFLRFLRTFLPDDYVQNVAQRTNPAHKFTQSVMELGKCASLDLIVLEVHHSSTNDARVGIAQEAFRLMNSLAYRRALIAFIPENSNQWRFSLLEITLEWDEKKITHSFSNPRRHFYLLGQGGSLNTPKKYLLELGRIRARRDEKKVLTPWEDLQSRFSVEALTKEFYKKLYNWYLWAVSPYLKEKVTFPNLVNTSKDDRDDIAIKIIRLITRLLFVWFIKQKGLVPKEIFDEDELQNILANFDPQSETDGKYYNAILQNLFFATLNNEVSKRRFMSEPFHGRSGSFGVKTLFRDSKKASWFKISHDEVLQLFRNVPFMNCGLFECLDRYEKTNINQEKDLFLDGFSSRDTRQNNEGKECADGQLKYRAFVPNILFFAKEEELRDVEVEKEGKLHKDKVLAMGLLPLLKLYNFTVQENTPSEVEVSLDPELLGQVFENLLAAYNPETKESARKSTGSFYTPRPIVEYMVNESLIAYLKTKVPSVEEDTWRALISYEDKSFALTEDQRTATLNALYECKILDPACGSGAFPMGMLQQMVHITRKLDSELDPYQTKLRIINNCIYGSDIQPIAMLISKLRFFISLICEQDDHNVNFADEENNFGINTLPNLETKFVAANSLLTADIHKYADDNWTLDPNLIKLKNELLKIRLEHFSVRTQTTKLRKREEDRLKRQEIQDYILQSTTQPNAELVQMYESRIRHLTAERELYEGEKIVEEFVDTQASLFDETKPQLVRKDINKIQRDRIDAEIADLRKSIAKEQNKRNPVGFNAAIKQIADWNPYDQLKAAPFFDADWMFGIKDGFDIVIGNPPYVNVEKIDKVIKDNIHLFETAYQKFDLYVLFFEKGLQLLREDGIISFITSNKFMSQGYGLLLRQLFLKKEINLLVNFNYDIFESATVRTCITQIRNCAPSENNIIRVIDVASKQDAHKFINRLSVDLSQNIFLTTEENNFRINLTVDKINILNHIREESVAVEDICSVNYGLRPSSEVLGLKKDAFIYENNPKGKYVPYFEGKDMGYWFVKYSRYIDYQPSVMYNPMFVELFTTPKLVGLRTLSDIGKLRFIYDDRKMYCNDSVVVLTLWYLFKNVTHTTIERNISREKIELSKKYSYLYIQGILNSKLIKFFFNELMYDGTHFYPNHMKALPIRIANDKEQNKIIKVVERILDQNRSNPEIGRTYEDELDILVYLLYKLTYDEVRIIDPQIESLISEQDYNKRLANA